MVRLRIISALILAPPVLAAVWVGSWYFVALLAVAALLLAWEWTRLCSKQFDGGGVVLAIMGVAVAFLGGSNPPLALGAVAVAALLAAFLSKLPARERWWMVLGAVYIGLPILSMVWLRAQGRDMILWLILLVWATDIGAYISGRSIGGPKLMPAVSPNKTWAGLAGGMVAAALVGWCVGFLSPGHHGSWGLAGLSALLAIVAQAGDLAESSIKRRFGVKDSSALIPGHGGLFDRVDGLLAAAPAMVALILAGDGMFHAWR